MNGGPAVHARRGRCSRCLDPERAHGLTVRALKLGLGGAAARAGRSDPRDHGVEPRLPQSGRPRRRLRQACRGLRRHAGARLRLRRGGHGDAAAAARQFRPAAVSALPRTRRSSTGSASTAAASRRSPGRLAKRRAAGQARHRRRQYRQEPRHHRRRRRLHRLHRGGGRACRLSRRQHLLAEHAGAARRCRRAPRSRNCSPACSEARRPSRGADGSRRCWSRSAPTSTKSEIRDIAEVALAPASTASSSATPRWRGRRA